MTDHVDELDISNQLSTLNAAADLRQYDDRIEALRMDIGLCETDIKYCEQQLKAWEARKAKSFNRKTQLGGRRKALMIAKRALEDVMEEE